MRPDAELPIPSKLTGGLLGLVPVLVLTALAAWLPGPFRLLLLLPAQALAVMAAGRVVGRRAVDGRSWVDTGKSFVIELAVHGLFLFWLWALVALPLDALMAQPSLGASLMLSLALCLALVPLWAGWPWTAVAALPFPDMSASDVISLRACKQRVRDAAAAAANRLQSFLLPVALVQLLAACGMLALAGVLPLPGGLPSQALLVVFALLVLPLQGLVVAWRLVVVEQTRSQEQSAVQTVEDFGTTMFSDEPASLSLGDQDILPGRREQALLEAARNGHTERALALLAADADPCAQPDPEERDQRSLLALASVLPDTRLLRALIARGADVQGHGNGLAPLLIATRDGRANRGNAVLTLLTNGADVRVTDTEGRGALHYAALADNPDLAAMLLDSGAEIDAVDSGGYSPLALACRSSHLAFVRGLLAQGACADIAGAVPALVATADSSEDQPHLVTLLVDHGAAVDGVDVLGRTALMHAALLGHVGTAQTLLAAGAKPDHADQRGTTALMEAARSGSNAVLALLAEYKADATLRDNHGRDALMLACQASRANADTIAQLLALGADPRAIGRDGRSALDHAAAAGRWKLVGLMDPETPLPAAHSDDVRPEPGADSPEHLLDALRFGHWAAVSGFRNVVGQWSVQTRMDLYLQLLGKDNAGARRWLLCNGLAADARDAQGTPLVVRVLEALPESMHALDELLGTGQRIAGCGLLARAMQKLGNTADGSALAVRLMEHDGDLFGADEKGRTPLHHAAAHAMHEALQSLLARGCNPNVRDAHGQTPLHYALQRPGHLAVPMLQHLIAAGAEPEAADAAGETPLGQALEAGQQACVEWLRWSRWKLPRRALRASDLPQAAAAGDAQAVARLLDLGFAVDTRDGQGATAMLRACGRGATEVAKVLLNAGADTRQSTPSGATALTAAVTTRQPELVALLLDHDVDLDQRLRGGATALLVAAALGHADIADKLLQAGADVGIRDGAGRGVLHAAAQFCFGNDDSLMSRRLLDVLLQHGADASCRDGDGTSVLLFMLGAHARPGTPCNETHLGALLPRLLDAGAPVNAADGRGVTALHACAMHALTGPAKLLLAAGADPQARDGHDRTPRDVASILGYVDTAHELGRKLGSR